MGLEKRRQWEGDLHCAPRPQVFLKREGGELGVGGVGEERKETEEEGVGEEGGGGKEGGGRDINTVLKKATSTSNSLTLTRRGLLAWVNLHRDPKKHLLAL